MDSILSQESRIMEMTGFNPTTFRMTPKVPQTQAATSTEVPEAVVWLPYLEDYLYAENDLKENNAYIQSEPSAKDVLYDQIAQIEEFGMEAIQKYSNTPVQSDSVFNGITVEVLNSGKQPSPEESAAMKVESTSTSRDSVSSPKIPRKATTIDYRRRREKANEREKQRIMVLKNAMNVLKNAIPAAREKTKITKLEVLKLARDYINSLTAQLMEEPNEQYRGYQLESPGEKSDLFVYCNSAP